MNVFLNYVCMYLLLISSVSLSFCFLSSSYSVISDGQGRAALRWNSHSLKGRGYSLRTRTLLVVITRIFTYGNYSIPIGLQ